MILSEDHKRRVKRLLRGERNVCDLHALFSDLRMHKPGRASVQEIGHFAAHRYERDAGLSLERANDIQTSVRLWHLQADGIAPTAAHLKEAGLANLRIMPEGQMKLRFSISRQTAEQSFNKAIKKFDTGRPLKERELLLLNAFGLSMMWQFALSDEALWRDFVELLLDEGSLVTSDKPKLEAVSTFVTLYALNIMHGARLKMADGQMTHLRLAESPESGFLRIKAEIPVRESPKPVTISVPMFETALMARDHCDPKLISMLDEPMPADIDGSRLVPLV
jgi:hypothetical protein